MTGEIFSRMVLNPEQNGQTSKGMEFDLSLNLGSNQSNQINTMSQDLGNRYFDLNLPSMDELIESKKRARTGGKQEPTQKADQQSARQDLNYSLLTEPLTDTLNHRRKVKGSLKSRIIGEAVMRPKHMTQAEMASHVARAKQVNGEEDGEKMINITEIKEAIPPPGIIFIEQQS